MGSKERQERDRLRIRQAILDAARELFVTDGYRNVSMRKIADRIEYSPAAIYSYFPAKDDIFFALAEEGFRYLAEHVLAAVQHVGDPFERLRRGLWAFYQFSKTHPEYFALMFVDRSVPNLSQDFQRFEFFQETTARAEADIRACIERGQFSQQVDPAAALHVLWVGALGAATIGLAQRLAPGEDPDALAHDLLESILAGFTTNKFRTTFVASECPLMTPEEPAVARTQSAESHKEAP
jgi:AcrR family transcriptional regulator